MATWSAKNWVQTQMDAAYNGSSHEGAKRRSQLSGRALKTLHEAAANNNQDDFSIQQKLVLPQFLSSQPQVCHQADFAQRPPSVLYREQPDQGSEIDISLPDLSTSIQHQPPSLQQREVTENAPSLPAPSYQRPPSSRLITSRNQDEEADIPIEALLAARIAYAQHEPLRMMEPIKKRPTTANSEHPATYDLDAANRMIEGEMLVQQSKSVSAVTKIKETKIKRSKSILKSAKKIIGNISKSPKKREVSYEDQYEDLYADNVFRSSSVFSGEPSIILIGNTDEQKASLESSNNYGHSEYVENRGKSAVKPNKFINENSVNLDENRRGSIIGTAGSSNTPYSRLALNIESIAKRAESPTMLPMNFDAQSERVIYTRFTETGPETPGGINKSYNQSQYGHFGQTLTTSQVASKVLDTEITSPTARYKVAGNCKVERWSASQASALSRENRQANERFVNTYCPVFEKYQGNTDTDPSTGPDLRPDSGSVSSSPLIYERPVQYREVPESGSRNILERLRGLGLIENEAEELAVLEELAKQEANRKERATEATQRGTRTEVVDNAEDELRVRTEERLTDEDKEGLKEGADEGSEGETEDRLKGKADGKSAREAEEGLTAQAEGGLEEEAKYGLKVEAEGCSEEETEEGLMVEPVKRLDEGTEEELNVGAQEKLEEEAKEELKVGVEERFEEKTREVLNVGEREGLKEGTDEGQREEAAKELGEESEVKPLTGQKAERQVEALEETEAEAEALPYVEPEVTAEPGPSGRRGKEPENSCGFRRRRYPWKSQLTSNERLDHEPPNTNAEVGHAPEAVAAEHREPEQELQAGPEIQPVQQRQVAVIFGRYAQASAQWFRQHWRSLFTAIILLLAGILVAFVIRWLPAILNNNFTMGWSSCERKIFKIIKPLRWKERLSFSKSSRTTLRTFRELQTTPKGVLSLPRLAFGGMKLCATSYWSEENGSLGTLCVEVLKYVAAGAVNAV